MANDDSDHPFSSKVVVLLIAMGSAAFVVSTYHVITICLFHQRVPDRNPPEQQHDVAQTPSLHQSASTSVAYLIPTHKYHKKKPEANGGVGDEDGTCAVCLGDFEEDEELRTMPECLHSFHAPCIDMWLHSHSSCPMCRASATATPTPSPSPALNAPEHNIDMTPLGFLHNGLARW